MMITNTKRELVGQNARPEPLIELSDDLDEAVTVSRLVCRCGAGREDDTLEEAATRLASMALMISNITAARLVAEVDGEEVDLAVGFAVEGGFLAADIADSVIAPAYRYQELWERNLLHDVDSDTPGAPQYDKAIKESSLQFYDSMILPAPRLRRQFRLKQKACAMPNTAAAQQPLKESTAACAENPNSVRKDSSQQQPANQQQSAPPSQKANKQELPHLPIPVVDVELLTLHYRGVTYIREALNYRVFLADATTTTGFEQRVMQAHLGRFIIHSSIASCDALERVGKTIQEYSGHRSIRKGNATLTLRADPVLCVGPGVLDEAVMRGVHRNPGINRLLWLVESAVGCDLPETRAARDRSSRVFEKFRIALDRAVTGRIRFDNTRTHQLPALSGELTNWRRFLRERERHCPGITSAVGNLPVALCYGLGEMRQNSSVLLGGDEVIAFAKWLVMRMVNRMATVSSVAGQDRIEKLAAKLANKLVAGGPMSVRDLTRKCSRLTATDCRKALGWLEDRQIATQKDNVWGILGDVGVRQFAAAFAD